MIATYFLPDFKQNASCILSEYILFCKSYLSYFG